MWGMSKKQEFLIIVAMIRWFLEWAKSKDDDYGRAKRLEVFTDRLSEIGKEVAEPAP